VYPACQPREMSNHNQYCNNMFNKIESNKKMAIDNNFKDNDELFIDAVRTYPHL